MTVRERAIYVAPESTFSTDPSADGSGYAFVPATSIGDIKDDKGPIRMDYFTGRNWPFGAIPGVDGGEVEIGFPVVGLSTSAGDGGSPPSDDWYTMLMSGGLGAPTDVDGEGAASLSTTALTLDTDAFDVQDVAILAEAALPSAAAPRAVACPIVGDGADGTYTLKYDPGVAFTGAAVAYGYERYRPAVDQSNTFALTYVFNRTTQIALLGCRIAGLTLGVGEAGALEWKARVMFDRLTINNGSGAGSMSTKSLLPTPAAPAATPAKSVNVIAILNNAAVACKSINIDWGLSVEPDASTAGANGRAGMRLMDVKPTVTLEPLWAAGYRAARRQENSDTGIRDVLIQIGGTGVGGVLNGHVIYFPNMVVMEAAPAADGNTQRQTVTFEVDDPITIGGAAAHPAQYFRF